jgi:DNA-binding LytR/AlgR family response regulator
MKVLIIEDEQLGAERLIRLLHSIDNTIEVVGNTHSIKSSVEWLKKNEHPDVILMDIELTDGQSFDIFNHVKIKSSIIFTTSYDEYALKAFKVNSIDYLLKPIRKDDLKKAFDKYAEIISLNGNSATMLDINKLVFELKQLNPNSYRRRFLVKEQQRLISVETENIAYFYSEEGQNYLVTRNKQVFPLDYTLEEMEDMLDPAAFQRANRAFIISIKSVQQISNYANGKLKLDLMPPSKKEVLVSREKTSDFKVWMGK